MFAKLSQREEWWFWLIPARAAHLQTTCRTLGIIKERGWESKRAREWDPKYVTSPLYPWRAGAAGRSSGGSISLLSMVHFLWGRRDLTARLPVFQQQGSSRTLPQCHLGRQTMPGWRWCFNSWHQVTIWPCLVISWLFYSVKWMRTSTWRKKNTGPPNTARWQTDAELCDQLFKQPEQMHG